MGFPPCKKMRSCKRATRDVPGIYPFVFVGLELISLTVCGATNHISDENILIAGHVLLSVSLCTLAYTMVNSNWGSAIYHPNTIVVGVLYGVLIGEHKQEHAAELFLTLLSLCAFLVCYVGVARRMDLQNTIASSEPIAQDSSFQADNNI